MQLRSLVLVLAATATGCVTSEVDSELDQGATSSGPEAIAPTASAPSTPSSATCTGVGRDAGGRGYGVAATLAGVAVPPIADTYKENPTSVAELPPGLPVAGGVFYAESSDEVDTLEASNVSNATVDELSVNLAGLKLYAQHVSARSVTVATKGGRTTSAAGSRIQRLIINGVNYGDVATAQSIPVAGVGTVALLSNRYTHNGRVVDAIRISVNDIPGTPVNEASEIVIAHAESWATFPQCPGA